MMSGVLFQGWDIGTLGNTLNGCVTQDPRVARCLKRLLLSTPLTVMCVCGAWTHVCIHRVSLFTGLDYWIDLFATIKSFYAL